VTFGSVDRRDRATFGSSKPNAGSQVAQKSPEIQNRGHIHRVEQLAGRAAGDACSYGERAYDPPHVRHLLLVLSRRVADERSGRSHPGESSRGCVAAASPVRAEAGPGPARHPDSGEYVKHVQGGAEVVVTMRGRRVARLVPVAELDPLADLRARGLVREPIAPRHARAERARLKAAKPVSDLVADQRR
jgi:prevent-host-death family protein